MRHKAARLLVVSGAIAIAFVVALAISLAIAASWLSRPVSAPSRPEPVPKEAVWTGGNKGGEWLKCDRVEDASLVYVCTVYSDVRGDKLHEGRYVWEGSKPGPSIRSCALIDGKHIDCADGRLRPIGTHVYYITDDDTFTVNYPAK